MCGFLAVFPQRNYKTNSTVLKNLTNIMLHRGPDAEGLEVDDWFAVSHRRLSIIDLDKSKQPFKSADGRYVLVYNGEIYNYLELREELKSCGYKFCTLGDTEVIVHAFDRWGKDCIKFFEGMFAFVLIDRNKRKAFAARDQLGIKPLFICESQNGLILSSEVKPLLGIMSLSLRENALYEQIVYRYVSGRKTIYLEVNRLPAGSFVFIDPWGKMHEKRYYDVLEPLHSGFLQPDYDKTYNKLKESIMRHTLSDVGYNVQLSGGLDSSFVTAQLSQEQQRIRTYSVSLDTEESEKPFQDYVSNRFKTEHYDYRLGNKDYSQSLEKATWFMDMPIVHGACVFLMLLCMQSRETSKVIITGEGADELFSGYSRYRVDRSTRWANILHQLGIPANFIPSIGRLRTLRRVMNYDVLEHAAVDGNISYFHRLIKRGEKYNSRVAEFNKRFPDFLRRLISLDQTAYLESLFERQDRMSMAASVESRVPFCTPNLFSMVNSWNPKGKFPGGEPKGVFKRIARRFFPENFVYRRKGGFVLPYGKWLLDNKSLGGFLDLISDNKFRERNIVDNVMISKLIDQHRKREADHSKILMRLIFFEVWHRKFIGPTAKIDVGGELFVPDNAT